MHILFIAFVFIRFVLKYPVIITLCVDVVVCLNKLMTMLHIVLINCIKSMHVFYVLLLLIAAANGAKVTQISKNITI